MATPEHIAREFDSNGAPDQNGGPFRRWLGRRNGRPLKAVPKLPDLADLAQELHDPPELISLGHLAASRRIAALVNDRFKELEEAISELNQEHERRWQRHPSVRPPKHIGRPVELMFEIDGNQVWVDRNLLINDAGIQVDHIHVTDGRDQDSLTHRRCYDLMPFHTVDGPIWAFQQEGSKADQGLVLTQLADRISEVEIAYFRSDSSPAFSREFNL